jgi:hypothetical protein
LILKLKMQTTHVCLLLVHKSVVIIFALFGLLFYYYIYYNNSHVYWNHEIYIIPNALPKETFKRLRNYLSMSGARKALLQKKIVKGDRFGRRRLALCPVKYKDVYMLLLKNDLIKGHTLNMFVDYRQYPAGSPGMDWHRDVRVMSNEATPDYYEVVLTLWNDSDCTFDYLDPLTGKVISLHTKPNTLVLVRPEGVMHRVSPSSTGTREILKCVFTKNALILN